MSTALGGAVVNEGPRTSLNHAREVLESINGLGYQPNAATRALKPRRPAKLVGLVLS
jgi:DNA-binding LacI/PurR family transcriptional regulator